MNDDGNRVGPIGFVDVSIKEIERFHGKTKFT